MGWVDPRVWFWVGSRFSVFCKLGWVESTIAKVLKKFERITLSTAFKARLDKIWLHRAVKFDFMADLTTKLQAQLLVVLGSVGLSPNFLTCSGLGWVSKMMG